MRYVSNGAFLPGIPARDLSDGEVAKHGKKFLLETGLYAEVAKPKKKEKIEVDQLEVGEKWQE